MKKSFVPISKQSKKAQKAYHSLRRSTWGILNPATRTMPNGRAYNRKKQKANDRSGRESSFDSPPLPALYEMVKSIRSFINIFIYSLLGYLNSINAMKLMIFFNISISFCFPYGTKANCEEYGLFFQKLDCP